ncbi:Uncharacterised protein [Mycobacteroides abscessus subsp. abscessus]|nr:Uncharacterised protein [Mycobacteroides abscessus subsp. abscessus]
MFADRHRHAQCVCQRRSEPCAVPPEYRMIDRARRRVDRTADGRPTPEQASSREAVGEFAKLSAEFGEGGVGVAVRGEDRMAVEGAPAQIHDG